jgi:hypothetical protein
MWLFVHRDSANHGPVEPKVDQRRFQRQKAG